MAISNFLISELQYELAVTEKFLARVPEDKMDWKPHEKSMTVRQLIAHISEIPSWVPMTMDVDEFKMDDYKAPVVNSATDAIAELKANGEKAIASLRNASDEDYSKIWKMTHGGHTLMEVSKYMSLRTGGIGQLPHHRAQLGVYLRLLDVAVPATYGPSADEQS
ncbi:MAG: DinB family protein [Chitinophagales bacterium]